MTFEESVRVQTITVLELYRHGDISMEQRDDEILELGKAMRWVRVCSGNPFRSSTFGVYESINLLREEPLTR